MPSSGPVYSGGWCRFRSKADWRREARRPRARPESRFASLTPPESRSSPALGTANLDDQTPGVVVECDTCGSHWSRSWGTPLRDAADQSKQSQGGPRGGRASGILGRGRSAAPWADRSGLSQFIPPPGFPVRFSRRPRSTARRHVAVELAAASRDPVAVACSPDAQSWHRKLTLSVGGCQLSIVRSWQSRCQMPGGAWH